MKKLTMCVLLLIATVSTMAFTDSQMKSFTLPKAANLFHHFYVDDEKGCIIIEEVDSRGRLGWIYYEKIYAVDAAGDTAWYQHHNH